MMKRFLAVIAVFLTSMTWSQAHETEQRLEITIHYSDTDARGTGSTHIMSCHQWIKAFVLDAELDRINYVECTNKRGYATIFTIKEMCMRRNHHYDRKCESMVR